MSGESERRDGPEAIDVPAPTIWPFVTAVGVCLSFAGVVTHAAVSAVGLVLALVGFLGWMRQIFPAERLEAIPVRPPALRARPAATIRRSIEHLQPGESAHRARVPLAVPPYSAGVKAGVAGGVAMAAVALVFGVLVEGSAWYPINLMAAAGLPSLAQADAVQLRAFNATALAVGIIVHGALSILVGLLYAVIFPTLPRSPIIWSGLVAPALWTALVWSTLGLVNPVLNTRIAWGWFVASQVAFGLAAGWVVSRARPVATMQAWPLAARMGLESPGIFDEEKR
jgi:hypothetical protein